MSVAAGRHTEQTQLLRETEILVEAGFRGLTNVFQDESARGGHGWVLRLRGGGSSGAPARDAGPEKEGRGQGGW